MAYTGMCRSSEHNFFLPDFTFKPQTKSSEHFVFSSVFYIFYCAYCLEKGTYVSNVCLEQSRKFTFFLWNMNRVSVIPPPGQMFGNSPSLGRKVNTYWVNNGGLTCILPEFLLGKNEYLLLFL